MARQPRQPAQPRPIPSRADNIIKHIDFLDIEDNGQLREVAVVKRWDDGSVSYIDVALLDNIDKGRIKYVIDGVHSDKYPLFELLSQARLSNGLNALDYFHPVVKIKRAPGHINTSGGGGLGSIKVGSGVGALIGQEFSDPTKAETAGTGLM